MKSYRDYKSGKLNLRRRAFRNRYTKSHRKLLMIPLKYNFLWVKIAPQASLKRISGSLCIA